MPEHIPTRPDAGDFGVLVRKFADEVALNFSQNVPAQPEDQLKAHVGQLLRSVGALDGLEVNWRTEVQADDVDGRPDLGITVDNLLTGHVELKRPGTGARPEYFKGHDKDQWQRFQALPNLMYTDGSEWSLYRSGSPITRVKIADDITDAGGKGLASSHLANHHKLIREFLRGNPVVPVTAQGLAEYLAPLARILRDEVQSELAKAESPLQRLAEEWGGLLFPEGGEAQFADAYAQTLTYALLLARFEGAESLRPALAVDTLQREHGLLAEALQLLEAGPVRGALRMPIELLERALEAIDPAKISGDSDPWLYFYEQFLGAYDPKLRNDRGVYYTPLEVVRAQVRLAGHLLRDRFGKHLGYAADDVVVLDPAVGTGTYALAVLDHATGTIGDRLGPGSVQEKLRDLANRLHAFEILVGPYSVAHLRLSQRLKDAGIADTVPKVYLTDTLESPNQMSEFTASVLQAHMTEERSKAQQVKKDTRVFVCLGNPPYDREERDPLDDTGPRKGGWVRHGDAGDSSPPPILEDFLAPAREAGQGVHLKNLYNDYVYFWRWALWKVFDSTEDAGIVTFITASSYLRGPGFVGMRRKMREVFDELWIIDLEGDNLGTRKTENVFAIRTPVAIAIGVRNGPPQPSVPAKSWKTRLEGSEQEKLTTLDAVHSLGDLEWIECSSDWDAAFYPTSAEAYFGWPKVIDLFPWQHSGVQMKRTWPIGETETVLVERWNRLMNLSDDQQRIAFRETGDRKVVGRYPLLSGGGPRDPSISELDTESELPGIRPYGFRALDRHWIVADSRVGDRMRPEIWRAHSNEQVYATSLLTKVLGQGPAAMVTAEVPDLDHFCGRGAKDVIPLWRNPGASEANVTSGVLDELGTGLGITVSTERLFAYTYGILAQPAYVERFWDELEQPPPHLPITKDSDLFQRVADHGAKLVYLHTYGTRFAIGGESTPPHGAARCTAGVSSIEYPADFSYDPSSQVLRVGDGRFEPVLPEVWNYSVSGLHIVKSWLDRRKLVRAGRKSSPLDDIRPERWAFTEELLALLWVIEATLDLQPEGADLLDQVCSSELFRADELPSPSDEERKPPKNIPSTGEQAELLAGE